MGVNSIILVLEQNFLHRVMIACMLKQIYIRAKKFIKIYDIDYLIHRVRFTSRGEGGVGGWVLGSSFAGCVPLSSQNPYPIIIYSVANYRPHLSHFWANVIVISRTEFNASRLLNIKTTA